MFKPPNMACNSPGALLPGRFPTSSRVILTIPVFPEPPACTWCWRRGLSEEPGRYCACTRGDYASRQTLNEQWKFWWSTCYISYKNTPCLTLHVLASRHKLYCCLKVPRSLILRALLMFFPYLSHTGTFGFLYWLFTSPATLSLAWLALIKINSFHSCTLIWARCT